MKTTHNKTTRTKTLSSAILAGVLAAPLLVGTSDAALVAHWTFDEGAGTTAADSSGNSITATHAGATGSWITGKAGSAYQLGNTTSRFEVADSTTLQLTGAVTVSAWVNPFSTSSFGVIAGIDQTGGSTNDMYSLKTDGSNNPFWAVVGPGTDVGLTASSSLATFSAASGDGWVHLVGVYDPVTNFAGLYVNGVLDIFTGTVPTSIQSIPATDFQMGHNASDSGGSPLRAAIDDIQIYSQALTATEVSGLFSNPGSVAVPEPSSTALLGLGGLALMLRRKRS